MGKIFDIELTLSELEIIAIALNQSGGGLVYDLVRYAKAKGKDIMDILDLAADLRKKIKDIIVIQQKEAETQV